MKLLHFLLSIPVLLITDSFAVSNSREMPFSLWPFPYEAVLPVSFAVLIMALLFFILGGAYAWVLSIPVRNERFQQAKKIKELSKKLADLEELSKNNGEKENA